MFRLWRRLPAFISMMISFLLGCAEGGAQSATTGTSNPVILPANTPVILHLTKSLYKKDVKPGQPVEFAVGYDVVVNGQIFMQSGTAVNGSFRGFDHTGKGAAKVLIDLGPAQAISGEMVRLASTRTTAATSSEAGVMGALGAVDNPQLFEKKVLLGVWVGAYVAESAALDPAKLKATQTPTSEVLRGGMVFLRLILAVGSPDVRIFSIVSTADFLRRAGDLDGAIEEYQQVLALMPASSELRWKLAELFREKGDFARAISECRTAMELDPENKHTRIGLIDSLEDSGDFDAAIAESKEAIRVWPERPYFHYLLGRALVKKNEPDAAIVELQWVLTQEKNHDWKASCALGRAFELKGDPKAAMREYHTALRAHGGDKECHAAYERLKLLLKK